MSRERARRREERLAQEYARQATAERRAARRGRLEALWSWIPSPPSPRRRAGTPATRRPRAQRAVIAGAALAVQVLTWQLSGSWTLRITVAILTLLAVPALTVLTFDRSTSR
jgi:Flp pilus assembly protein TadB